MLDDCSLQALVGAVGFEPTALCAQGRCATKLRYAPTSEGRAIEPRSTSSLSTTRPVSSILNSLYHKNRNSDHFWGSKPHSTASFRAITTNVVFLHLSDLRCDVLTEIQFCIAVIVSRLSSSDINDSPL